MSKYTTYAEDRELAIAASLRGFELWIYANTDDGAPHTPLPVRYTPMQRGSDRQGSLGIVLEMPQPIGRLGGQQRAIIISNKGAFPYAYTPLPARYTVYIRQSYREGVS